MEMEKGLKISSHECFINPCRREGKKQIFTLNSCPVNRKMRRDIRLVKSP